jgi:hypothetical protein
MARNRLQHLSPNDWTLIKAKSVRRTFKLGEEIIKQGAVPESIFIIRRGEASVEMGGDEFQGSCCEARRGRHLRRYIVSGKRQGHRRSGCQRC